MRKICDILIVFRTPRLRTRAVPCRLLLFLIVSWFILLGAMFVLGVAEYKRQMRLAQMEAQLKELDGEMQYLRNNRRALVIWLEKALHGDGINNKAWRTIHTPPPN